MIIENDPESGLSPTAKQAVERVVRALHAAYPEIAATGVRPPAPGLFIGMVAGQKVHLVPGKRFSRLFLLQDRQRGRLTYFKWCFNLFKKGPALRRPSRDDETRLVLWLTNAAVELESQAAETGWPCVLP